MFVEWFFGLCSGLEQLYGVFGLRGSDRAYFIRGGIKKMEVGLGSVTDKEKVKT
jgi:hypothetical protein